MKTHEELAKIARDEADLFAYYARQNSKNLLTESAECSLVDCRRAKARARYHEKRAREEISRQTMGIAREEKRGVGTWKGKKVSARDRLKQIKFR